MGTISVREARERIAQLLNEVAAGEEIIILRRGQPAARLVGIASKQTTFLDRRALRQDLPPMSGLARDVVRELRDEERY